LAFFLHSPIIITAPCLNDIISPEEPFDEEDFTDPPFSKVFLGKAGIRAYLGFGDNVVDTYDPYEFIVALTNESKSDEIPILGLRDKDTSTLADKLQYMKQEFTIITMTTKDWPRAKWIPVIHDDPKVRHWYAMNYNGIEATKCKVFPLGIDFHTMHGQAKWGEKQTPWKEQNEIFHKISSEAIPWNERTKVLYVTYYSKTHASRKTSVFKSIAKLKLAYKSYDLKPRWTMLRDMATSKFVLAPRGLGMSSIRFYEALAMGAIPIADKLKSEPMNQMLKMLGGIVVDDWKEVTDENLELWMDIISKKEYERNERTRHLPRAKREFLFTEFWMNCVKEGRDCVTEHFEKLPQR